MMAHNAPYFGWWEYRHRHLEADAPFYGAMYFSRAYFEKLRRELESAGYGVGVRDDLWYSPPLGFFFVSDTLVGECFVFVDTDKMFFACADSSVESGDGFQPN